MPLHPLAVCGLWLLQAVCQGCVHQPRGRCLQDRALQCGCALHRQCGQLLAGERGWQGREQQQTGGEEGGGRAAGRSVARGLAGCGYGLESTLAARSPARWLRELTPMPPDTHAKPVCRHHSHLRPSPWNLATQPMYPAHTPHLPFTGRRHHCQVCVGQPCRLPQGRDHQGRRAEHHRACSNARRVPRRRGAHALPGGAPAHQRCCHQPGLLRGPDGCVCACGQRAAAAAVSS